VLEHLLDTLDRAVQLADQVFIGSGEQIGKKSANLRPNFSIFRKRPAVTVWTEQ
jgi:hypothetical protein